MTMPKQTYIQQQSVTTISRMVLAAEYLQKLVPAIQ
jgi:hypothetical protein